LEVLDDLSAREYTNMAEVEHEVGRIKKETNKNTRYINTFLLFMG
jgi:hypothetical protein